MATSRKNKWWPIRLAWHWSKNSYIEGYGIVTKCGCMRWIDWHGIKH